MENNQNDDSDSKSNYRENDTLNIENNEIAEDNNYSEQDTTPTEQDTTPTEQDTTPTEQDTTPTEQDTTPTLDSEQEISPTIEPIFKPSKSVPDMILIESKMMNNNIDETFIENMVEESMEIDSNRNLSHDSSPLSSSLADVAPVDAVLDEAADIVVNPTLVKPKEGKEEAEESRQKSQKSVPGTNPTLKQQLVPPLPQKTMSQSNLQELQEPIAYAARQEVEFPSLLTTSISQAVSAPSHLVSSLSENEAINTVQGPHFIQGGGDEDEGVEEDSEDTAIIMDPNHPLLERVQKAIYEQLSKHEHQVILDVRDKELQVQKEIKEREDHGVELYTLQQNLARLQASFEGAEENYGIIQSLREDAERILKHSKNDYEKEQEKLGQHQKNCKEVLSGCSL